MVQDPFHVISKVFLFARYIGLVAIKCYIDISFKITVQKWALHCLMPFQMCTQMSDKVFLSTNIVIITQVTVKCSLHRCFIRICVDPINEFSTHLVYWKSRHTQGTGTAMVHVGLGASALACSASAADYDWHNCIYSFYIAWSLLSR